MRLRIQHPLIQTNHILRLKQQIKVLERLGEPKALHLVVQRGYFLRDVVDGRVAVLGGRVLVDGDEHAPAGFAPVVVACDAVHVPYGLDGFGAVGGWC